MLRWQHDRFRRQVDLMIAAKRKRVEAPALFIPQRRVLRPRLWMPGIAPLPRSVRPPVNPGSASWTSPGSFNVLIPEYNVLTMYIWGAGGGGGGVTDGYYYRNTQWGGTGGTSYFGAPDTTIYAYGGTGGGNSSIAPGQRAPGDAGSHGGAANGNVYNTTGGGNAGGAGAQYNSGIWQYGGNGGNGGLVTRQWTYGAAGAPIAGQQYLLVLGAGGAAGWANAAVGSAGQNASATLQWS
jgi:hypothetical protein